MKKLLLLAALFVCVVSQAQVSYSFTADTAKAADEATCDYPYGIFGNFEYSVQIFTTRIYGTDTFAVYLQGSNDGTNYSNIDTVASVDSATTVNGVSSSPSGWEPLYLRISLTADAGDTVVLDGSVTFKPINKFPANVVTVSGDTITNSASENLAYPYAINDRVIYGAQVVYDELSGAATCTCKLQESNDNTNWTDIIGKSQAFTADGNKVFTDDSGFESKYIRLNTTCTGTQTSIVKTYWLFKHKQE